MTTTPSTSTEDLEHEVLKIVTIAGADAMRWVHSGEKENKTLLRTLNP